MKLGEGWQIRVWCKCKIWLLSIASNLCLLLNPEIREEGTQSGTGTQGGGRSNGKRRWPDWIVRKKSQCIAMKDLDWVLRRRRRWADLSLPPRIQSNQRCTAYILNRDIQLLCAMYYIMYQALSTGNCQLSKLVIAYVASISTVLVCVNCAERSVGFTSSDKALHLVGRGRGNKSGSEQGTKSSSLASFGERVEVCVYRAVWESVMEAVWWLWERGW